MKRMMALLAAAMLITACGNSPEERILQATTAGAGVGVLIDGVIKGKSGSDLVGGALTGGGVGLGIGLFQQLFDQQSAASPTQGGAATEVALYEAKQRALQACLLERTTDEARACQEGVKRGWARELAQARRAAQDRGVQEGQRAFEYR